MVGDGVAPEWNPEDGGSGSLPPAELRAVLLEYLDLAAAHPPDKFSVVVGHAMWMLGRSGKGKWSQFKHTGPYSAMQLRMALNNAGSVDELRHIVDAVLPSQ